MIVTRIGGGGLGIQLFQYATGWVLAQRHQTKLFVHRVTDAGHRTSYSWDYRLDSYELGETFVEGDVIPSLLRVPRLLHEFPRGLPTVVTRRSAWTKARFQPDWDRLPDRVLLEGVRGGYRYLSGHDESVARLFTFRGDLSRQAHEVLLEIQESDSIVVHWRLGDYQQSAVHASLGPGYFLTIIRHLLDGSASERALVFSDDPGEVGRLSREAGLGTRVWALDLHSPDEPQLDLALMTHAKTFVMSNSTYSWWAAYLNTRPGHCVIAPPTFFAHDDRENQAYRTDVLRPEWQVWGQ